jgi:hypothetical protein
VSSSPANDDTFYPQLPSYSVQEPEERELSHVRTNAYKGRMGMLLGTEDPIEYSLAERSTDYPLGVGLHADTGHPDYTLSHHTAGRVTGPQPDPMIQLPPYIPSPNNANNRSSDKPQSTTSGAYTGLIRDAPTPTTTDFSAKAQIIRTARSRTGRLVDFTWKDHYNILYESVVTARISELNTKLALALKKQPLMRTLHADSVPDEYVTLVLFSQTGQQKKVDWMWCVEHINLLKGMDLSITDLDPEQLDSLVKKTGGWVIGPC